MSSIINQAIFQLRKRAEKYEKEHLVKTFVDAGPLFTLLSNPDHQIIYGRRGTGKTHALSYLQGELEGDKHIPVYIDMRNVGSNGGIYADNNLPLSERASRLLIDTFGIIHDQVLDYVLLNDDLYDLSQFGPLLDNLSVAISEIEVLGDVEIEETKNKSQSEKNESGFGIGTKDLSLTFKDENSNIVASVKRQKTLGPSRHRVHFTTVNSIFSKLKAKLNDREIWILIDEWAEVPLDLQPYLADLLRRTLFSVRGITVKIAAIEKRTNFKLDISGNYLGIETGADISASLNLDEFMVFDNDPEKAKSFFKSLIYNHVNQFLENNQGLSNKDTFVNIAFTQIGAFEELVRASEGIPRDAINILIHAAIKADQEKISIPHIRAAARNWYISDKEKSVNSKFEAQQLLRWVVDEVIGKRNSRAFLLNSDTRDSVIEYLVDNRILHLIKQNISSKDKPGERYNVYAIDYGTYVHLINTSDEPKGLLAVETDNGEEHVEVPLNDYRSIRRSILNLQDFYANIQTN